MNEVINDGSREQCYGKLPCQASNALQSFSRGLLPDAWLMYAIDSKLQFAYNTRHTSETVLLWVQNDTQHAVGRNGGSLIVLLDLSVAFDTIDHILLHDHLHCNPRMDRNAFDSRHEYAKLSCGVPACEICSWAQSVHNHLWDCSAFEICPSLLCWYSVMHFLWATIFFISICHL